MQNENAATAAPDTGGEYTVKPNRYEKRHSSTGMRHAVSAVAIHMPIPSVAAGSATHFAAKRCAESDSE